MPKVSIIIPTYNRANYLCQSVESALAQDYDDFEVIVSDNASSDNTPERIGKYSGNRKLKYFRNDRNLGMVPNWRKALYEYANGDWTLVLDDDDYLIDNSYVSKAMRLLEKEKDIVAIHANCRILYEDTGRVKDTDKRLPEIVSGKWMFMNYKYGALGDVWYSKSTTIFNRALAIELDFFREPISSSDREGFLKISVKGKVAFVNDVVAVYRMHGGNLFKTQDLDQFFDNLKAVLNPYEYVEKLQIFGDKELEKWRKRMITEACEITIAGAIVSSGDKFSFLKTFTKRLFREYPFALTAMVKVLTPRTIAKMIAGKFVGGQ
jgi:glycosyltransferase involved in cell wall biosynthesis